MAFCSVLIVCAACTQTKRDAAPEQIEILSEEERLANAIPKRETPELTAATTNAAPAGTTIDLPAPQVTPPAEAPEMNDFTSNLVQGFWQVIVVVEGEANSREPYKSQKGRFWRFNDQGVYQLFNADGSLFHEGTWSFERIDDKRNYLTLKATALEHSNYYRAIMQPEFLTMIGTERFNNTDVQQRMQKLPAPPVAR